MRHALRFLLASLFVLAVTWAAGLSSTSWGPRNDDLGLGLIFVGAFAAGHVLALGLAFTGLVLAAIRLGDPAARTRPAFATFGGSALLVMAVAVYLATFLGVRASADTRGGAATSEGTAHAKPVDQEESLRAFLRRWAADTCDREDPSTEYSRAWVSLRDDGARQVIVYIEGACWCGSGGCNTLVLEPDGESFRIVGNSRITRPPIRILARVTHGWHDIGVRVAGGGIHPAYDAGLPFDGKEYPLNPTVPPARNATGEGVKATAITGNEPGQPLWK